VEERFSLARMARDYVGLYRRLIAASLDAEPPGRAINSERSGPPADVAPMADLAAMNGGKHTNEPALG
jgi:hypothetical protein